MSQFNLLGESQAKLPMAPNLNQTLLFIETNRYFPSVSQVSIGQNIRDQVQLLQEAQISIVQKMQPAQVETITSTSLIKKKKTGCTCKKTKCLKMYCECFSLGKACNQDCSCLSCRNDPKNSELAAKARENIKQRLASSQKQNYGKGCNCKKTQCQKKYCECYNAGVACGGSCRCEDCENMQNLDFGNITKSKNPQVQPSKSEQLM